MCHSPLSQFILTTIPPYSQGSWGSWLRAEVAQHLLGVSWSPSEGLTGSDIIRPALSPQDGPDSVRDRVIIVSAATAAVRHNEGPHSAARAAATLPVEPPTRQVPPVRSCDLEHCAR